MYIYQVHTKYKPYINHIYFYVKYMPYIPYMYRIYIFAFFMLIECFKYCTFAFNVAEN